MYGGTPQSHFPRSLTPTSDPPTSIQLGDGTVFTVYYMNTAGSNCFIAGTFWRLPPDS
jgi:hypothetical protein